MRAALALMVALLAFAGCGGDDGDTGGSGPEQEPSDSGDDLVVTHPDARTIHTLPLP